jgi:hypothetical protein
MKNKKEFIHFVVVAKDETLKACLNEGIGERDPKLNQRISWKRREERRFRRCFAVKAPPWR